MADDQNLSTQDIKDLQEISQRLPAGHPTQQKISLLLNSQPTQIEKDATPAKGFFGKALDAVQDFGAGAVKGAGHTLGGLAPSINKIPYVGETLSPSEGINAWNKITTPTDTAQKVGYGTEQIAEFLTPAAEEKAGLLAGKMLPGLGKFAPAVGRIGASAIQSGAINKLQGGTFSGGAAMGAGGAAVGEAGRALAPKLAESALGITKKFRGFDRTPGEAALNEIGGIRPGTIAENATDKLSELTRELGQRAAASTTPATTQPALDVLDREMQTAIKQNNKTRYQALRDVKDQLTVDFSTGQSIPTSVSAQKVLDLKRGIGDLEGNWNPELRGKLKGTLRQVYKELDNELDRTVPGADELNQRISSLIPVKTRAASEARGADFFQRALGRVGAHTGALAGALYGGHAFGPVGAAVGLLGPELVASPTGEMLGARVLNSPFTGRAVRAAGSALLSRTSKGKSDE